MSMPEETNLREEIAIAAQQGRYTLANTRVHRSVVRSSLTTVSDTEFLAATLIVERGTILDVLPQGADQPGPAPTYDGPIIECGGRIALPGFLDCHTHLDKGHIAPRTPSADGSFPAALATTALDRAANWSADDVAQRMDFALRSAYAYGTVAVRTHIDSQPPQDTISWPVFAELREQWRGRIDMQGACLFGIELLRDEAFLDGVARRMAATGGVLGAVVYPTPDVDQLLDNVFATATRYDLDLDFHADETGNPAADALRRIAEAALRAKFPNKVLVGHCCSLAMQDPATVDETLDITASAGVAVVSLPSSNIYLQDRRHDGTTPRWRGVTLVHEMERRGIAVAVGSDNTRDPFYAYGDLDMLETFRIATRILHLDHQFANWPRAISCVPASIMRRYGGGMISAGLPADLILFEGRNWSELLSRPESNRIVIRNGAPIDAQLPAYSELDHLSGMEP